MHGAGPQQCFAFSPGPGPRAGVKVHDILLNDVICTVYDMVPVVHWRPNIFAVPYGREGAEFVRVNAGLVSKFVENPECRVWTVCLVCGRCVWSPSPTEAIQEQQSHRQHPLPRQPSAPLEKWGS